MNRSGFKRMLRRAIAPPTLAIVALPAILAWQLGTASPAAAQEKKAKTAAPAKTKVAKPKVAKVAPAKKPTARKRAGEAGPVLTAHGAETGVNVAPTSGDYFTSPAVRSAIGRLHPAWVRVFMGWNAVERSNGVYNSAILRDYRVFFAHLPPGTRVLLDVEGTPAWAAGGWATPRSWRPRGPTPMC